MDLENLCRIIPERLLTSHPGSLPDDIEVCIGGIDSIASENASAAEISLSREMIITIGCWLGNEEQTKTLLSSTRFSDGTFGEQLFKQLVRHGMYMLIYILYFTVDNFFLSIYIFSLGV